jgi:4-diphosphocytidyl-2-C-methyl-D-erythritol kinase
MVKLLSEFAPAKINLYLRVTGQRSDGYHEIDSIFLPVSLGDRITIELRPAQTRAWTIRCNVDTLSKGDGNLAFRAARMFMDEFGVNTEVLIDLGKEIPIGAGLGGGSSDAATVLRMMALLCRIDEPARLAQIALGLGADVPFFLNPVPARVRGIGEQIMPLAAIANFALLIAVPPVEVATATVFRELRREHWSGPASDDDVSAITEGRLTSRLLVNDLTNIAMAKWPQIAALKTALQNAGARAAAMTGSGSAVFGVFATSQEASRAAEQILAASADARVFVAAPYIAALETG